MSFNANDFVSPYVTLEEVLEIKKAFDDGLIEDYSDVRYHNQRFLKAAGSPIHKDEFDAQVMAAFANHRSKGMAAVAGQSPLS